MTLVSHPTGNTFVRALLDHLKRQNRLGRYATSFGFAGTPLWLRFVPASLRAEVERRTYAIEASQLDARPWREVIRIVTGRLGTRSLAGHETGWACVDAVYRDLDAAVARRLPQWVRDHQLRSVYAYEDGALATLRAARQLGLQAAYELPIAYWQKVKQLLQQEAERLPEWERTLGGTRDSEEKLARKTAELEAADLVVCPSQFVLDSIPAPFRETRRCIVAEFGSPPSDLIGPRVEQTGRRLRVLFAGSMSQRKGLADVFTAMQCLERSDVELVVMGSLVAPLEFYRGQYRDFIYEPPRPHAEVLRLMDRCDVLVLPSIAEGRALVQQEAMSRGLPLIVTANAGGEDLVEEERTGFLVPIRSPESIAEKIAWFADHRDRLPEMRGLAMAKARERSWESYGEKIFGALDEAPGVQFDRGRA